MVNNHSDFYYQMIEDIKYTHKIYQYYNEFWVNKYELYKSKLERLEKLRDYYLIKCWKSEQVECYNTFLTAIKNCQIKMNRYKY